MKKWIVPAVALSVLGFTSAAQAEGKALIRAVGKRPIDDA